MARFSYEDASNYGGGSSSFFSLKDDKESARVRFLINDINDLYGVSCHEVEVDGRKFDVECLRAYNEPVDNCPLCAANYQVKAKLFIPLYDINEGVSKVWTRSKKFFDKISGMCERYNPLVSTTFDIERHGKRGDPKTTYEIYPITSDNKRLEDFPPIVLEEIAFRTKTYEELENFLRTGTFEVQQLQQRQPQRSSQPARQVPVRRTPNSEEIY